MKNQYCRNCIKWKTPGCSVRKDDGIDSSPFDWCRAWKKGDSLLDHERQEDARLERLEVERERKEVRG